MGRTRRYRYHQTLQQRFLHYRFAKKRKKVLLKMLINAFRSMVLKQSRIRNMQLVPTASCNFKCDFCSSSTLFKQKEGRTLSLSDMKRVVDEGRKLGVTHLDITGGEPLLKGYNLLCELIGHVTRKSDLVTSLCTNGWLVTKEGLVALKEAGLHVMFFHLESTDAQTHDDIVGARGSFDRVLKAIENCRELEIEVCINTILSAYNFTEAEKLSDFCESKKIFCLLSLAGASGRWLDKKDVRITDLYDKYYQLLKRPYNRSDSVFNYRTLGYGCPAGVEKVYITAYGEVMPCTFSQICFGNVLDEPLGAIYRKMSNFPLVKKYSHRCKHTFDPEYNRCFLDPLIGRDDIPIPISEHPLVKNRPELRKLISH